MFILKRVRAVLKAVGLAEAQLHQSVPDQILHYRQRRDPYLAGEVLNYSNIQHNTALLQNYYVKSNVNPTIQYNYYSNNNYIPELLIAYSVVVDGEFLLEWCEYFCQL